MKNPAFMVRKVCKPSSAPVCATSAPSPEGKAFEPYSATSFFFPSRPWPSCFSLFRLFTKDEQVIEIGIMMMRFLVPTFMTYICIEIYSGALRGMGDSLIPMLITCGGICGLRVIWLFTAVPKWNSMKTVMASYPITWVITSILFLAYYTWFTKKHRIC